MCLCLLMSNVLSLPDLPVDIDVCVHTKLLQSCLTLCDPMDSRLPGFSVHGILLGKNTGVGCHALLQGNLPDPGIKPCLLICFTGRWILTTGATWEAHICIYICMYKYLIKLVKICLTGHFKELILIYISSALFPSVLISPLL